MFSRLQWQDLHEVLGLLRTHVGWRADELFERGEERLVGQVLVGRRLGDAEVDDLGHCHGIMQGDQDVRGLDVAVDDSLLMRVLDGLANLDEEIEPVARGKLGFVTILRDLRRAPVP
jgi:hypothetical protein